MKAIIETPSIINLLQFKTSESLEIPLINHVVNLEINQKEVISLDLAKPHKYQTLPLLHIKMRSKRLLMTQLVV